MSLQLNVIILHWKDLLKKILIFLYQNLLPIKLYALPYKGQIATVVPWKRTRLENRKSSARSPIKPSKFGISWYSVKCSPLRTLVDSLSGWSIRVGCTDLSNMHDIFSTWRTNCTLLIYLTFQKYVPYQHWQASIILSILST